MIQSAVGIIAGVIAFVAFIPYVVSILKGETKPQRATFAIWSVIGLIIFFSYLASGARETVWTALAYAIVQIGIFGLSFKYGMGGFSKLDMICIGGAVLGIVGWITTKDPAIALYLSIFSEFLGYVPLFKKSYLHPRTENTLSWVIGLVASCLNVFALTSTQFNVVLYPVYVVLCDGLVVSLLVFSKHRVRHKETRVALLLPKSD